jgi:peptidoglycan/xylan/chitin deacetylase (PgdA/CDA1 family)
VIWTVHSDTDGDQSLRQDGALTVNAPVSIRVPIIMYHNVAPVPQDVDWTTPDQLRADIVALQAYGYTPITSTELMNYRAGIGTPPAKPVMLTFDDGYGNFYTQAFPVLFALNAKSTVFIITLDADNNPNAMNWTQLQELNGKLNATGERLVDVEGHTVTHPDLTTLDAATLQTQLVNSKQNLESHLGKEIRLISYPFGYTNLTVEQAAWQAGYAAGVIAWGGTELTSANKWELKRVGGLTTTSVIYNPSQPGEFLFTKIADPTVVVPLITINSIQYLDAAGNALPSNTIEVGQTVRVRVIATNTGPATSGLVSLKLDNDSNHNNGVVYDSRLSGGDLVWNFASGTQTFDFNWAVPTSATTGQYYADVTFDDQYHVLYFKDSGWQTAFIVSASGQTAPTITTQPQSQTVKEGTAVTFSVVASGSAPLGYQWQRNGANIAGATSASYTLSSPTVADSGAQFRAVVTNDVGSVTSSAATLTVSGTGTGLQGQYFDNSDFTNLKLTRTDATVNFNWGTDSPHSSIGADTFSVRWTGQVQPQYSETYTFYVTHNDGARLWVNNQLIVSNWTNRSSSATSSGSIKLVAGQKYNIQLDYYENTRSAVAQLAWSSPRVTRQIIPAAQLHLPASQAAAPQ